MIEIKITIREGKEKIGVGVQMKGMKTASLEELEEFTAIYDALMTRPGDLAKAQVKDFMEFEGKGPKACEMLRQRIKNL